MAVSNQIQQEYIGADTRVIHEKWLKKWEGTPHKTVLYGVQYCYSDMNISTEYDPRSGSDAIIINYREARENEEPRADFSKIKNLTKEMLWKKRNTN